MPNGFRGFQVRHLVQPLERAPNVLDKAAGEGNRAARAIQRPIPMKLGGLFEAPRAGAPPEACLDEGERAFDANSEQC